MNGHPALLESPEMQVFLHCEDRNSFLDFCSNWESQRRGLSGSDFTTRHVQRRRTSGTHEKEVMGRKKASLQSDSVLEQTLMLLYCFVYCPTILKKYFPDDTLEPRHLRGASSFGHVSFVVRYFLFFHESKLFDQMASCTGIVGHFPTLQ